MTKECYFVTVGKNPFGAMAFTNEDEAVSLAKQAKLEFPNSDVVVWCEPISGSDPFEVWENE